MAKFIDAIESDRIYYPGIEDKDADLIVKWRSDPKVYRYFKSAHKISKDEHVNWYKNTYLNNINRYDWMCFERTTSKRIGVFGIVVDGDSAEVNYLLSPDAQHKGYAKEGVINIIEYAKSKWSIKHVFAEIHIDNKPSIDLAERIGFIKSKCDGDFLLYRFEV